MTYEYRCPECGVFEMDQKITDPPIEQCPICDNEVKRIVTGGTGVIYNAPGFTKKPTKLSEIE